jgi:hypothetical protein
VTNDQELLFGAMKPHKPFAFTLAPGEVRAAAARWQRHSFRLPAGCAARLARVQQQQQLPDSHP